MNSDANPIATLVWTFGLMSLFAVGGANSAIPEMHRVAVEMGLVSGFMHSPAGA